MEFHYNRILAGLLAVNMMLSPVCVYANETEEIIENTEVGYEEVIDYSVIETNEQEVVAVEDLGVQLDGLYKEVGNQLNLDSQYIRIIHLLAGGKAIYDEALPNIYNDETVVNLKAPFEILGANTEYNNIADWANCGDPNLVRPNKYYVPDAAYNVAADIVKIMNDRNKVDRGLMNNYFDSLELEVRVNILFCEAVMQYTGSSQEAINSFYGVYEKILYDKESDENVVEADETGKFYFKDKFKNILVSNGIDTELELNNLAIILSFDGKLAISEDPDELQDSYVIPYEYKYHSRENMMIAAMSIVGKVRYVWGGGHLTNGLVGISPSWEAFNSMYGTTEGEEGYNKCIKPSDTWCPVHGSKGKSDNSCLMGSEAIHSTEEYIEYLENDVESTVVFEVDKYNSILSNTDLEHGISAHRLDGLDCSGFTSWLYSQVDDRTYDAGARAFIGQAGIKQLKFGSVLLPGDVFSWGEHIIAIIGRVGYGSKAYVTVESTPNMVKFGVAYYSGASISDISYGIQIANEANRLIGNLPDGEDAHVYNMTDCVYKANEGDDPSWEGYHAVGRLSDPFIDEKTVLNDIGKTMSDMVAVEVIQHTIDKLPGRYLSGIDRYDGYLFNTDKAKESMRNTPYREVESE